LRCGHTNKKKQKTKAHKTNKQKKTSWQTSAMLLLGWIISLYISISLYAGHISEYFDICIFFFPGYADAMAGVQLMLCVFHASFK
jgi:hypothetical protein